MKSPFVLWALTVYPSALPEPSSGIILICCDGSRFRRTTFPRTGSITVGEDPQFDRDVLSLFQIMSALADRAVATRSKFFEPGMVCRQLLSEKAESQ